MTFTDRAGESWAVEMAVGDLRRLRSAGVDLKAAMSSPDALTEILFGDPEGLVKALWVLCEGQATARGVSPESFADRFDGRTLEAATEALLGAVADFFPRTRVGQEMRAAQGKLLAAMDEKLVTAVRAQTARALTSTPTAGASPGSPGWTPPPVPSAS